MAGSKYCRKHGGGHRIAFSKLPPWKQALRLANAEVSAARRRPGGIDPELIRQPVWHGDGSPRAAVLRPLMMAAWSSPDPEAWPRVVAQVEAAVGRPLGP